jgi:hypothetical protein
MSSRAARVRSRLNQEPIVAGKRERQVPKGVSVIASPMDYPTVNSGGGAAGGESEGIREKRSFSGFSGLISARM